MPSLPSGTVTPGGEGPPRVGRHAPSPWDLLILVLSVFVLFSLFYQAAFSPSQHTLHILQATDTAVCMLFLADFIRNYVRAESKLAFLKWGWFDLVSSIPTLHLFRWGRAVEMIRILWLLRGIRSVKILTHLLLRNRAQSAFAAATLISLTLVLWSSLAILRVETAPQSNIRSGSDALWWACVTITSVGYGDRYPVTAEGRAIGVLLMVAGVGLFGGVTAYVASWLLAGGEREEEKRMEDHIEELKERIASLEDLVRRSGGRGGFPGD